MTRTTASIANLQAGPAFVLARPRRVGLDLGQLVMSASQAMTAEPVFAPDQEPLADGRSHVDLAGRAWSRADPAIALTGGAFSGPAVEFLKEPDGTMHLEIEIVDRLAPGAAGTLGTLSRAPRIRWAGGQIDLPMPTPVTDTVTGGTGSRMMLRLLPDQVAALFAAMTDPASGAVLMLDYAFGYVLRAGAATPPLDTRPIDRPVDRGVIGTPLFPREPRILLPLDIASPGRRGLPGGVETGTVPRLLTGRADLSALAERKAGMITLPPEVLDRLRGNALGNTVIPQDPPPAATDTRKTADFQRRLPFVFDRALDQNAAIFRAITGGGDIGQGWQDTEYGVIRPSEFANTLHLLPHEIRLAYDAARGLPHMMPVHYAAPDGAMRLRVVLRAEPWFDPGRVMDLGRALTLQAAGAYLAPQVIGGGIAFARLRLNTIFPEAIEIADAAVDLRGPFDLTLDFSEENYALFCTILTGPVGLTGHVEAVLRPAAAGQPDEVRIVPLVLAFGRLGAPPLEVSVAPAPINPDAVRLTNRAAHPLAVGGVAANLLQLDANAIRPAAVLPATPRDPPPADLAPGETAEITLLPPPALPGAVWNAVDLVATGTTLAIDAGAALRAIHALAPPGSLGWRLRVISPQLGQDPATAPLAVEVRLALPGGAPFQITVMPQDADRRFTVPRSLDDLARGAEGVAFLTLTVQARGVWADGFGPWSDPRENIGETLFVFVQPPVTT